MRVIDGSDVMEAKGFEAAAANLEVACDLYVHLASVAGRQLHLIIFTASGKKARAPTCWCLGLVTKPFRGADEHLRRVLCVTG